MQINNIKTITDLSMLNGRLYVHLATKELALQFLQQAEAEGFDFRDGVRPTSRRATEVMAVNPDHTLNYVGAVGHVAYASKAKQIGRKELIRVSYLKPGVFLPESTDRN